MTKVVRDTVIKRLEEYQRSMRRISQLHYELEHLSRVSPDEIINAMAFAKGSGESQGRTGHISDKTLYIAMNYQEEVYKLNNENREDIISRLIQMEQEIDRLERYVSLLEEQQADVIRRIYFFGQTMSQVSDDLHITERTLRRIKSSAIDELAEMYEFVKAAH